VKKIFGSTNNSKKIFPKDPKRRKRIYTFSSFLLLSILFWLTIKLSQENVARFELNISLHNIPADMMISNISHERIFVDYSDVGIRLLYLLLFNQPNSADLDFYDFQQITKDDKVYFFITGKQAALSYPAFSRDYSEIVSVHPDTLFFEVETAKQKKVPVVFDGNISFSSGFNKYGDIKLQPDSLTISGPQNLISSVDTIFTSYIDFGKLDSSVEKQLDIVNPFPSEPMYLSDEKVNITIDVREFTEANSEVKVEIECPEKYRDKLKKVRLFPSHVTIYYLVALEDYSQISDEMFSIKAECPFEKDNDNRLNIRVDSKPQNVEIIRFNPSRTEYILLQ